MGNSLRNCSSSSVSAAFLPALMAKIVTSLHVPFHGRAGCHDSVHLQQHCLHTRHLSLRRLVPCSRTLCSLLWFFKPRLRLLCRSKTPPHRLRPPRRRMLLSPFQHEHSAICPSLLTNLVCCQVSLFTPDTSLDLKSTFVKPTWTRVT